MFDKSFSHWYLAIYAFLWAAVAFALLWFNQELSSAFWIVSLLIWVVVWLAGLTILCLAILELFHREPWRPRVNAIAFTLPLLLATVLRGTGFLYPIRLTAVEIPRYYEPEARRLLALTLQQRIKEAGSNVRFEEGHPLRIAFVESGGILDNWSAVVYDPTDVVMKSNAVSMDALHDPKHAPYVKLFGGDLCGAESLGGHWYRCFFT